MKEKLCGHFTRADSWMKDGDSYVRYSSDAYIMEGGVFKQAIESMGGRVYNVAVGRVRENTIFNGTTWVSIRCSDGGKSNDDILQEFVAALKAAGWKERSVVYASPIFATATVGKFQEVWG